MTSDVSRVRYLWNNTESLSSQSSGEVLWDGQWTGHMLYGTGKDVWSINIHINKIMDCPWQLSTTTSPNFHEACAYIAFDNAWPCCLAGIGIYNGMRDFISVAKLHRLDRARHQRIDRRKDYRISCVGVHPCVASHRLRSAALSW